jgi:hypothetical protein
MDHKEEQAQELESLSFIYPDELEVQSETHFTIHIKLDDPEIPEEEEEYLFSVSITFPESYPEVLPEFEIESSYLREEEMASVTEKVTEQLQESLGIAMVFTLVSMLKEEAEIAIKDRNVREEQERELEKLRLEEEEQKKYQGTKVTRESFLEWQNRFLEEAKKAQKSGDMIPAFEACLAVEKLLHPVPGGRPTGRQLFERDTTLLESDEKYMEEGEDVEVNAETFVKDQDEEDNQVLANLTED